MAFGQVARAVCSTALRGNAALGSEALSCEGRGPLGALDQSLLVDLAAAVLDSGWRYITVEGVKAGLSSFKPNASAAATAVDREGREREWRAESARRI